MEQSKTVELLENDNAAISLKDGDKSCEEKTEPKYFLCEICGINEKYEYFGKNPSFSKEYKMTENSYIIEDPFMPPKQGEILILGAHCIKCNKSVCKDINCSFYYDGTHCIKCAKENCHNFPQIVQEKLNKIVSF